ncbi:MAG: InlB B-repeat-containing protein [Patescibacteria group bacterium]
MSQDWRWIPTSASGNTTLTSPLLSGVSSSSLSILAGQTENLVLFLDSAVNGGIFSYSLDGSDQSAWALTASESFDSTNGADGTWSSIATSLTGDEYGPTDRLRHVNISASNSPRWFKFSITNNYSSSQSIINVGLHKFSANNDYWVFVGASLVNMAVDYRNMSDAVKSEYGYDPLIFNTGVSGTNIGWLDDNIDIILAAHPRAKFIAIDMGGNNVSFSRPYSSTTQTMRDSFVTDFRSVIQKIKNSGKVAIPARMTFRNYPHEYPGKPGVYGGGMEQNGSLPFNTELLDPIIADMTPDFYDASAGHGAVDLYNYFLNNQWVLDGTDGVHPNVLGREFFDKIWRDTAFHFAYHGTMPTALAPQTFKNPAQDASALVIAAETSRETADINTAQAKLTELNSWPEFSAEQNTLQIRLNNVIPTSALFYLVDFGRPESNYITTPNWNNLSTTTINSSINLITNAGATSSLTLKISHQFTGVTVSGLDFTDLPFTAERDGFLVRSYISPDSILTLSGLNQSKKYTFVIYSGASFSAPDNITDFTINGVKKSIISNGNTSQLVQFDNIMPSANGEIIITVGTDTNYGIINAMSIRETENPPSCIDGILNQDESIVDVGGVCGTPITLSYVTGAHGSLSGTLSQTINSGSNGSAITAIPDSNYHFVNWSDGSTENPITHTGVTTNINLTANFAINQNTLTYVAGANGFISGNALQFIDYNSSGSSVTAVPSNGYHFVNWSDNSVQNPRTDLNVVANISVTANFSINTPTCSDGIKNQNETGIDIGGICSVRTYLIDFGTISSTQTSGNWNNLTNPLTPSSISDIIDNTGASSSIDIAITNRFTTSGALGVNTTTGLYPQNVILDYFYVQNGSTSSLKFSSLSSDKTYNFNFFASRAGTGTRNSEFIINSTSVVLNAMNNSDNTVSINGVSPDINREVSINIRPEGSATYAYLNAIEIIENPVIINHTLTYTAGTNGSLTGSSTQIINHGADGIEITAVPSTNYHFSSWSDGVLTAARTDTSVTGDKTVIASFIINSFTLAYAPGANGTVTGSSTQLINHGSDGIEVTAIANNNYHFVRWSDNVMTAARKDTNVIAGKSVIAIFALDSHTFTYNAGNNGSLTGSSTQIITHGSDTSSVTATPNSGYHFTSWSDGILTATRKDINVISNNSVTANFALTSVPVISLIGAKHVIIYKDQTYSDPGASAYDSVDGNLTNITSTSTVNTAVAGSYSVKYNTKNSSQISATEVVRTVEVKDLQAAKSTISNSDKTNIYIPTTVVLPTIDLVSIATTTSGDKTLLTLPADINITKTTTIGDVVVNIPAGINLSLSTSTWNGIMNLPQLDNNPTVSASSGNKADVFSAIEIGLDNTLVTFDKAVKITFPGAKDKFAGWSRSNEFTKITNICLENSQSWTDSNIEAGSDCKINSGNDLVIWTKHFTTYTVYTESSLSESSDNTNSSGNSLIIVNPIAITENKKLDFTVNNNNKFTNSNKLTISLNADPKTVSGYAISLDNNFNNSSIIKYSQDTVFNLPSVYGKYNIYLKYFSTSGHSSPVIIKSIEYIAPTNLSVDIKKEIVKNITTKPNFKKDLKLGLVNNDVKELQKYLNNKGYLITKSGPGSKGKETTYFGAATKAALIKFQKDNKISPASGLFGPVTRRFIHVLLK